MLSEEVAAAGHAGTWLQAHQLGGGGRRVKEFKMIEEVEYPVVLGSCLCIN